MHIHGISTLLQPLETVKIMELIPALTGQPPPNDELRNLLALPARLGGIALANPTSHADVEFSASTKISDPTILQQSLEYSGDVGHDQVEGKGEVCKMKRELYKQAANSLKQSLPVSLQCSMDLAQVKGASTCSLPSPIQEYGFALHKCAFQDALALRSLRYNWQPL